MSSSESPYLSPVIALMDVEHGEGEYKNYEANNEHDALLPSHFITVDSEHSARLPSPHTPSSAGSFCTRSHFNLLHLSIAFVAGSLACFFGQYALCGPNCFSDLSAAGHDAVAPPYVASTEVHNYPPASPTNAFPSFFPTGVGHAGGTPTGAEPAVIATAPSYPIHSGAAVLVAPASLGGTGKSKGKYDLFKKWGNLSPWYSVDRNAFGLDSGPETPETCRVTGLHFLHRHGARYPTAWGKPSYSHRIPRKKLIYIVASYGGPAPFAQRLNQAASKWTASRDLEFMNEWCACPLLALYIHPHLSSRTYKLGEESMYFSSIQCLYSRVL